MTPYGAFGLLYGKFLASIDDETRASSMMSSIFIGVMSFTGFASSYMFRKYSVKTAGYVGAISYTLGCLTNIFNTNLIHLVISFSILKGFGFGLLMSASFTIMNSYFDKKHNLVMGISQAIISLGTILCSPFMAYMVKEIGYTKTLIVWTVLSLLSFPAVYTFHPIDRYLRKEPIEASQKSDQAKAQVEPLLLAGDEKKVTIVEQTVVLPKENMIYAAWRIWLLDTIGLRLFGDLRYINMATGLAIPYNSDCFFIVFVAVILSNLKFQASDIALMNTVFYSSDFLGRILYSIISGFCAMNNYIMFMVATFATAVLRIVFVLRDGYTWKMATMVLMGLSRAFMETPLPLVISEKYKVDFSTAYSMHLVISGCVSLLLGYFVRLVNDLTHSDIMVTYFLAAINFIPCFTWTIEIVYDKLSAKKSKQTLES
ncbi:hypothetical protein JTB14_012360 [Gonioctena quinquepunctata]|nr:hypothetical protein JTB14_012360 [Gonioctena quinquepunctata]